MSRAEWVESSLERCARACRRLHHRGCQPVLSLKVPVGAGWIHELKHDGFRVIALKDGDEVPGP